MMRVQDLDSYDVKGNTVDTRIEIVSCRDSEDILIRQYKDRGYTVLGVDRVYEDEDTTILRPIEVLRRFKTLKKTGQVVIVGLSYYLRLWNQTNTNDFFGAFRDLLDSQRSGLILIIQRDVFSDSVFSNPRYQNSIVFLQSAKEIESTEFSESVAVLDADSAPASLVVGSYKELVHRMCNPLRNDRHIYAIRNRGTRSIGFTNVVLWPDDPSKILDLIWDYKENLPTDTSSSLLKCCVDGDISPVRYIDKLFGKENLDKVHVLNRICELSDEAVFSAILVYLKRRFAADSYIGKALESYSGRDQSAGVDNGCRWSSVRSVGGPSTASVGRYAACSAHDPFFNGRCDGRLSYTGLAEHALRSYDRSGSDGGTRCRGSFFKRSYRSRRVRRHPAGVAHGRM